MSAEYRHARFIILKRGRGKGLKGPPKLRGAVVNGDQTIMQELSLVTVSYNYGCHWWILVIEIILVHGPGGENPLINRV